MLGELELRLQEVVVWQHDALRSYWLLCRILRQSREGLRLRSGVGVRGLRLRGLGDPGLVSLAQGLERMIYLQWMRLETINMYRRYMLVLRAYI